MFAGSGSSNPGRGGGGIGVTSGGVRMSSGFGMGVPSCRSGGGIGGRPCSGGSGVATGRVSVFGFADGSTGVIVLGEDGVLSPT